MKKFWDWMIKKARLSTHELSYVEKDSFVISAEGVIYKGSAHDYFDLPKQMLIGYMIEYMTEEYKRVFNCSYNVPNFKDEDLHEKLIYDIETWVGG